MPVARIASVMRVPWLQDIVHRAFAVGAVKPTNGGGVASDYGVCQLHTVNLYHCCGCVNRERRNLAFCGIYSDRNTRNIRFCKMFRHLCRLNLMNKSSSLHNVGTKPPLIYIFKKNLYLFIRAWNTRNTIYGYVPSSDVLQFN